MKEKVAVGYFVDSQRLDKKAELTAFAMSGNPKLTLDQWLAFVEETQPKPEPVSVVINVKPE